MRKRAAVPQRHRRRARPALIDGPRTTWQRAARFRYRAIAARRNERHDRALDKQMPKAAKSLFQHDLFVHFESVAAIMGPIRRRICL
jgi:hypothetical protein